MSDIRKVTVEKLNAQGHYTRRTFWEVETNDGVVACQTKAEAEHVAENHRVLDLMRAYPSL